MPTQEISFETIVSQPFAENSYVVRRYDAQECFIVDPGFEPELIEQFIDSANLVPIAILNTHGHSDHIAGNAAMKQRWPDCPLWIGEGDAEKLTDPTKNLSADYGAALISPPADRLLVDGEQLELFGTQWKVANTPGHSSGHIVFIWEGAESAIVVGGDVLFQGSVGRTDFYDGSFEQLRDSIHQRIFTLPDPTIVLPGHGPTTTVGAEKAHNPFVGRPAGYDV